MGVKIPLIIYTHTDYSDVWVLLFNQIKKYLNVFEIFMFVNDIHPDIPSDFTIITYDDTKVYTERLKECLNKLDRDIILFMHEDMIPLNTPNLTYINQYIDYIYKNMVDSVKLIYVTGTDTVSTIDTTLITNEYSKFSIQPTLIKVNTFLTLLDSVKPLNIWDFEAVIRTNGRDYMCKIGGEVKRGLYHCDSIVFPYIATAIVKGKWNFSEYNKELTELFTEYNIIEKRGRV
jgi:hypothetical protein